MAKSYRSKPEHIIAKSNIARDADGHILMPHIIQRKPAYGDIHPLDKATIKIILRKIPIEYVYGLKRIELRTRDGKCGRLKWSQPLGYYLPIEKTIWLYSYPIRGSVEGATLEEVRDSLCAFSEFGFAPDLQKNKDKVIEYHWPNHFGLGLWYSRLLFHELGHHFVEQYRHKNSRIKGWEQEELVANLHRSRMFREQILSIF